jgi:signal transduction histidine kinase
MMWLATIRRGARRVTIQYMAGVAVASRGEGNVRHVIVAVALAFAVVSVSVAAARSARPTTYGAGSTAAAVADLAAGLGAIAAGCLAFVLGRHASLAALMTLIGVTWLAADWTGWEGGPAVARSIAMVVAPFLVPVVLHLALAYPTGRISGRAATALLAVAYGGTAIASVGRALLRDPFRDLNCWDNCTDNVFLVRPDRDMTRLFDGLGWRAAVSVGVVGAVACVWRLASATSVARRAAWFVLVPACAALLAAATYGVVVIAGRPEDPTRDPHQTIFLLRASSVAALAVGFAWGALRSNRTGRAVARLAEVLGSMPAPGTLATTLAASFGDAGLEVAYRLSGSDRYVDASGHPADPRPRRGQATTAIVRDGQPLAVVVHDRALVAEHDLEREIGAAARLAVDNERLRAENLAQLEDLRASRARLVATTDATRRRLERDLHDGAQQRLLAVLYELRLARSAAATGHENSELLDRLDKAAELAGQTLAELRELAHGIYPAILVEAGLGPALRTLADRAPIAVDLDAVGDNRFPADVEAVAYLVVAETIIDASRKAATTAGVHVKNGDATLVIEVEHDGTSLSGDLALHLADSVGAIGGQIDVDGTAVRAELPCVS